MIALFDINPPRRAGDCSPSRCACARFAKRLAAYQTRKMYPSYGTPNTSALRKKYHAVLTPRINWARRLSHFTQLRLNGCSKVKPAEL
jgi:hypothetical protein